jgi:CRISPR system Cascade subunit CasE
MTGFHPTTLLLRTFRSSDDAAGRKKRLVCGPDATFEGRLQIGDPQAFAELVARGVGRYRAFGFGMLLLRPAVGSR